MEQWKKFENDCYEYLKNQYSTYNTIFHHNGGSDSTVSDISVIKHGKVEYYIETKMSNAQSGQFVLLPDEIQREFVFSPKNKSTPNFLTELITEYMNNDFDKFNNAGTAGVNLNIDNNIFSKWIINYYAKKNVKYLMTRDYSSYIIFPISQFGKYFDVSAKFRIKKSGSREPAKKDFPIIKEHLKEEFSINNFNVLGKKLFITSDANVSKVRFIIGNYTYYLSPKEGNLYEIRCLSNTYNMNVIFSISLKRNQDLTDLKTFENDL